MSVGSYETAGLEIAHVLFMDLVGYSLQPLDEQHRLLSQLQAIVRDLPELKSSSEANEPIRLPTGDGMALVFFKSIEAPVRCAVDIARAVAARALKLRMGIHSGPVYRMQDINGNSNVSGSGINLAQRVMERGEEGHILLSENVAQILSQVTSWRPLIRDLGDYEVKHGIRMRLYNLVTDGAGRIEAPAGGVDSECSDDVTAYSQVGVARLVILHARDAQPDSCVLEMLERKLATGGHSVFVDRNSSDGVQWAKEIGRGIAEADAVIVLLSMTSIASEMLAYGVEIARESSRRHGGKPKLLPVRIKYEGPLPDALAAALDTAECAQWRSADDDDAVARGILYALQPGSESLEPVGVRLVSSLPMRELESVGGAVPLGSRFYVTRPTDEQFMGALSRKDGIVLVKGARQMGKTSLLARGLQSARAEGATVVLTDFQKLGSASLESSEKLYLMLAQSLVDQLGMDVDPDSDWSARRGPNANFERFVSKHLLTDASRHVVWGMDEVDRLFSCPFSSEVFGLFRSWFNERALDPDCPMQHLTMAIAYATEAELFITDVNQSPFNVGTQLRLSDFSPDQVSQLNALYGSPLRGPAELERFFRLLGGQPYLVRRGLNEMAERPLSLDWLEQTAISEDGPFGDHLRRILVLLASAPELLGAMTDVLAGKPCPSRSLFYRLRGPGIVTGDSPDDAAPRCKLYADYLAGHL